MMSLKRHFLKNFPPDFSEMLVADIKLILGKVLKVSRRYLSLFLGYRENPAGGRAEFAPPPSGMRVKRPYFIHGKYLQCYLEQVLINMPTATKLFDILG